MNTKPVPLIESAESFESGVAVRFKDGRCAFFSAALLQRYFDQAKELIEEPEDLV